MRIVNLIKELFAEISSFKTYNAWFVVGRGEFLLLDWIMAATAALGLLAALVFWWLARTSRVPITAKYLLRWKRLFFWFGLLELIWAASKYQFVGFFGTRAAYAFVFLVSLIQALRLVIYGLRQYKIEMAAFEAREQKEKYLR